MPLAIMPAQNLIFGNFLQFRENPLTLYTESRQYGDLVRLRFAYDYNYAIHHPDLVHQVLVSKAASFSKDRFIKNALGPFIGKGLTVNEGDAWKRQRKMVQPAFHAQRIARYADIMVQHTQALMDTWRSAATRNLGEDMLRLTSGITSKSLFDLDISDQSREFNGYIDRLQELARARNESLPLPLWLPTHHNRQIREVVAGIDTLVLGMVRERLQSGSLDRGDLLSMLLLSEDEQGERMTEQQLRDEAVTLFVAGNDTTYNALMWLWYCLAENPAAEAVLHAELDSVLAGRTPTLEDLRRLPYTEQVVKETLRLYSPAWAFIREVVEDVAIGDVTFRKGMALTVSPWVMHRDERFFDAPEKFMPERWSPENEARIPKYAYFPFGGGPRVCIGNSFAMMELRLILATVAQRYTLDVAPGHVVEPQAYISLRPKYGMKMVIQAREPEKTVLSQA